jgi:hypothetical protein
MSANIVLSTSRRGKKMASVSPRAAHAEAHDRHALHGALPGGHLEDTNNDIQDKHGINDTNAAMKRPLGMWDASSHALVGAEHIAAASQHHQPRAGGKAGPQRQQMSLANRSQSSC